MKASIVAVQEAIDELEIDKIENIVKKCLDEGIPPLEIIENGVSKGLDIVGKKFETGEYFLAELVMAGEVAKAAMAIIEKKIEPGESRGKGTVILATIEGDLHDIGKNIVGMLLGANGYEIIDLGTDVPPSKILETVKKSNIRLVGLSALLSTTAGKIKEVVDSLAEAGLKDTVKVIIGGAGTSEKMMEEMGADAYGETAIQAVTIFDQLGGEM
jgi:5-methyltetrahydrofolate--homocysteine methyltransferase